MAMLVKHYDTFLGEMSASYTFNTAQINLQYTALP